MIAVLYAGQGAAPSRQQVELARRTSLGETLVARALSSVGLADVDALFARGGRALERTAVLQPVLVAVSVALARELGGKAHLGHSLGEISALAAAGAMEPLAAVDLAAKRGAAMARAASLTPGGLFALSPNDLPRALELGGFVALDNAPDEVVVGGDEATLSAIARVVPGRRLRTEGAWHGRLMEPALEDFAGALAETEIVAPRETVLSCVDAEPIDSAERARACLARGLVRPVRLREAMAAIGVRHQTFVIAGPGAALRALVRRNLGGSTRVQTIEDQRELERARALTKEAA